MLTRCPKIDHHLSGILNLGSRDKCEANLTLKYLYTFGKSPVANWMGGRVSHGADIYMVAAPAEI
jgi:hypothetical protein